MLYKMTEWKSSSGLWYCNCVDNLGQNSGHWVHPARILSMTLVDYVKFVIKEFNPEVNYNEDCSLIFFSWEKQSDMRKFKNFINKKAREVNYQI